MTLEEKATKFDELLISIGLKLLKYFAPEGVGLSIKEMLLVEILGQREFATVTYLASALSQPLTTMTSAITRMVRNGYLERRRIEEDRRVVLVSLSPQGRAFYEQHRQEHIQMAMGLLQALPEQEQDRVIDVLDQIASAASEDSVN
ncbi:MAG: MarR family transcriptional regulator [Anaerolinea sp.]|nr:MarR family transcriptional regulator [Anaerolinea sp.]